MNISIVIVSVLFGVIVALIVNRATLPLKPRAVPDTVPPPEWVVISLPVPATMIQLLDQLALENKMDRQGATRVVMMLGAMALIESSEMNKPTIMQ